MENKYKINNYESVILTETTIEKEGYNPNNLAQKSNKYIWVTCRYCGEPNRTKKSKYTMSGNSNCHIKCRCKELKETDSTWSRPDVKEKIKNTLMKKYGVDHSSKIEGILDKRKKTFMNRFGVDNPSKAEEIKQKKRDTCLKNHGTEYPLQNREIFEKSKKTVQERYGVDRPAQNEDIKEKMINSFLEIYSYDNPMKDENVRNLSRENLLKHIDNDEDEKFALLNFLRKGNSCIWKDFEEKSLSEIAKENKVSYNKLRAALYDNKDLREKFIKVYCYPKRQMQNEVYNNIKQFVNCYIEKDNRSILEGLELDIYIPSKKFALEFNGNLWHSEKFVDKNIATKKHKIKLNLCRENGIRLFQIFEHQWAEHKDQILNFLKTILGANTVKIPARKCLVTNSKTKEFINRHHIQGSTNSVLQYFNLEYNGEIVASMTASIHHRQISDDNSVVLSRLCFKDGVNVQGGSSKLFKAFVKWAKDSGYSRIISWSDNCWTEGKVYEVLGFSFDKEYPPDYFYWDVNKHQYHSKQSQKKSSVNCPSGMTEREYCIERGLYRVWDCGKKKWVYDL